MCQCCENFLTNGSPVSDASCPYCVARKLRRYPQHDTVLQTLGFSIITMKLPFESLKEAWAATSPESESKKRTEERWKKLEKLWKGAVSKFPEKEAVAAKKSGGKFKPQMVYKE